MKYTLTFIFTICFLFVHSDYTTTESRTSSIKQLIKDKDVKRIVIKYKKRIFSVKKEYESWSYHGDKYIIADTRGYNLDYLKYFEISSYKDYDGNLHNVLELRFDDIRWPY